MIKPGRGNWDTKHGGAKRSGRDPEYNVWAKMLARCRDHRSADYKNYGGRGITVCIQWHDYGVFRRDMGERPSKDYTIERIDNDENYSPENCKWATRKEQAQNRRPRQRQTTCKRGHALSGENEYIRPGGKRGCRTCRQKNMQDFCLRNEAI